MKISTYNWLDCEIYNFYLKVPHERIRVGAASRTRKGGWRIAQSPILTSTITLLRLKKKGYRSMLETHIELNPSLCEPPYT